MPSPSCSYTDSPWFWAYAFATAGLMALALVGPKFARRQAQLEREFQGRQRAAQSVNGHEPAGQLSTAERTMLTLQPLFFGLAAITTVAWIIFWRSRRIAATPFQGVPPSRPLTPDP